MQDKGCSNPMSTKTRKAILRGTVLSALMTSAVMAQTAPTQVGPVLSGNTSAASSYLRVFDTGTAGGTVTVQLRSPDNTRELGTFTAPVAPHAARQFSLAEIEAGARVAPATGTRLLAITANFPGFAQHLVYNASNSELSIVSGCGPKVVSAGRYLNSIHTALIRAYPSTIIVQNTSAADATATFEVYDAANGDRVGRYSGNVRANNVWAFSQAEFAAATGFVPSATQYQLNFVLNPEFPGTAQHVVRTINSDQSANLTETCALPTTANDGMPAPQLPATTLAYRDAARGLPDYFTNTNANGSVADADNTPPTNAITDAGATLGRVLFYDQRLSINNTTSCASCHQQARGFSDPRALSVGFAGGQTARHSMGLSNARFYENGRFFWDERAATLEDQVLQPIQNDVEMGMTLPRLTAKLAATDFYPGLFQAAFGSTEVNSDRISKALAQFVRSLTSYQSKYDTALAAGPGSVNTVFTPLERQGLQLFGGPLAGPGPGGAGCARCHEATAQIASQPRNNGLNATNAVDAGAGGGRFKVPSLRNIAVRGTFMHDGRFSSLAQVVEFYNSGVQANPNLDRAMRDRNGNPQRLNLTQAEKAALVAFMATLTDQIFLTDPKFGDPFQN
jgi:cytochrome c peroxidase